MIHCPYKNLRSVEDCSFSRIKGSVRDAPDVGVKKCQECGVVVHNSDLRNLVDYPSGSMWVSAPELRPIKEEQRTVDILRRLELILELSEEYKKFTFIDFGCGSGELVKLVGESIPSFGIEIEAKVLDDSNNKSIKIFNSVEEAKATNLKFQICSLFHVIEHLYDANKIIEDLKDLISEGGIIILETPNADDALATLYDCGAFQDFTYWSHHPMIYSRKALLNLLINQGFHILNTKGVQRYSLENHLHWLSRGLPGGHNYWKNLFSENTLLAYNNSLIEAGLCDTLLIVAVKL